MGTTIEQGRYDDPAGGLTCVCRRSPDPGSGPDRWSARWRDAVEAGGRGEFAAARTRLRDLTDSARVSGAGDARSLAASTAASFLRQAGRHRDALVLDAHALALVGPLRGGAHGEECWPRAAFLDALVGLAADNLGLLRLGAAARLLGTARTVLDASTEAVVAGDDWETFRRPRLRLEWVGAELGIYAGRPAAAARHAELAAQLTETDGETHIRHRVKTELIGAAVAAARGDVGVATVGARDVVGVAAAHGLLPLQWAGLSLVIGVGASTIGERKSEAAIRERLTGKGMPFALRSDR